MLMLSLGWKIDHVTSSLPQKEPWEKFEKIHVLFFKIITHLKPHLCRLNKTPCDILHIENNTLQPLIQSFAEKKSILMYWPNVSLRDVTEGHFLIANLDT